MTPHLLKSNDIPKAEIFSLTQNEDFNEPMQNLYLDAPNICNGLTRQHSM